MVHVFQVEREKQRGGGPSFFFSIFFAEKKKKKVQEHMFDYKTLEQGACSIELTETDAAQPLLIMSQL